MLWGKTSRPAPRVSTLVPFIINVLLLHVYPLFELAMYTVHCCCIVGNMYICIQVNKKLQFREGM